MNRCKTIIILILLTICSIFSKEVLNYSVSLDYVFDSNISRNIYNNSDHYIIPALNIRLNSPHKIPFYLKGSLAYDNYLRAREYDDNSPFMVLGVGYDDGSKRLKLCSEVYGEYYMGFGVENGAEAETWKAVIRTAKWNNVLSYKKKRKIISLEVEGGIQEYAKEEGNIKNGKTAYLIELNPSFYYKFKKKKKTKVRVKKIGLEFKYELQDAYLRKYDFSRFSIPANLRIKLFRMDINTEVELAKKLYQHSRKDNIENKQIIPYYNRLCLSSEITIPLISHFKLSFGGKLRYRNSNWRGFDYDRHTAHLLLKWQHKIER